MEEKNILVKVKEYAGKYVALESFKDSRVVSYGMIPKLVMEEARSKGHPEAVIVFIPEDDAVHVY